MNAQFPCNDERLRMVGIAFVFSFSAHPGGRDDARNAEAARDCPGDTAVAAVPPAANVPPSPGAVGLLAQPARVTMGGLARPPAMPTGPVAQAMVVAPAVLGRPMIMAMQLLAWAVVHLAMVADAPSKLLAQPLRLGAHLPRRRQAPVQGSGHGL
ncbi:UNVERIFIED_CONTAM: hypothetical protein K2H54_053434 [Gekko kuhli]